MCQLLRTPEHAPRWAAVAATGMVLVSGGCADRQSSGTEAREVIVAPAVAVSVDALPRLPGSAASDEARVAPAHSGWVSEEIAAEIGQRFQDVVERAFAAPGQAVSQDVLSPVVAPAFSGELFRPAALETVFSHEGIEVLRPGDGERQAGHGAGEGLRLLTAPFQSLGGKIKAKAKAKVIGVELDGDPVKTRFKFEAQGSGEGGRLQQRGRWLGSWERDPSSGDYLLTSVSVESFEEVRANGSVEPWFRDSSREVFGGNRSYREQVAYGLNHWLNRVERVHVMLYFKRHGLAVGDANGDGLDDVYLCQPGGLPNRLYLQNADGTVIDRSAESGTDWLDNTSSALFVDLDNDGDPDLVLAVFDGILVLENDGAANFTRRTSLGVRDTDLHGLCAADFDNDGDLDFYVTVDFADAHRRRGEAGQAFRYHDANDGGANVLFRNDGEFAFSDVTDAVGLGRHNRRHSLAAAWEDVDNDGDQDLYVANDYGQNCLYRNHGGRFEEEAVAAGVVDHGSGMSVSWGDYDRDSNMDLYVGNMFSSAGSRLVNQPGFLADSDDELRRLYGRFTKGNSMFRNRGDATFDDVSFDAGVSMGRWAWSSLFADLNHDGWEDLFVANGYITAGDTEDL